MNDSTSASRRQVSKQILFRLLAVAFGVSLLGLVELTARLLTEDTEDPFVSISAFTLFSRVESGGEPRFEITHPYAYPDRKTSFPVTKAPGTLRVFVLGGSAAAGWPHPPEEIFTAYLQAMIEQAEPGRRVEIINAAAHGFPAYRVRRVFDEIVDLDPDAVVVYSGNNEFLERRSYRRERASALVESLSRRFRTVSLLSDLVGRRRERLGGEELNEIAATMWTKVQQESLELRSDPEQFAAVQEHFAASLGAMAVAARARGIPLLLATVPVNLRDWIPTVSHRAADGPAAVEWERLYRAGREGLLEGRPEEAIRRLSAALDLEPRHAESHYWLGRAAEAQGDGDRARRHYLAAKDLDYNPFRAHSAFNRSVRELATESPIVTLVDLEAAFGAAASGAAPGFDLFLDYVHMTTEGNWLATEVLFETLVTIGLVAPESREFSVPASDYDEADDYRLQMRIFGMATMNHQYAAALARAERVKALVESAPEEARLGFPPGAVPLAVREAIEIFPRYLELERRELLGRPVSEEEWGQILAEKDSFYEKWYRYLRV